MIDCSKISILIQQIMDMPYNQIEHYGMPCQNRIADCAEQLWKQTLQRLSSKFHTSIIEFLSRSKAIDRYTRRRQLWAHFVPFLRNKFFVKIKHDYLQLANDLDSFVLNIECYQKEVLTQLYLIQNIGETLQSNSIELEHYIVAIEQAPYSMERTAAWKNRWLNLDKSRTLASQQETQLNLMQFNATVLMDQLIQIQTATLPLLKNRASMQLSFPATRAINRIQFEQICQSALGFSNKLVRLLQNGGI